MAAAMRFSSSSWAARAEQQPVGIHAVALADLHHEAGRRVKRAALVVLYALRHAEQFGKIDLIEVLRRAHLGQPFPY
jgi:hypothetical protein